jgi:hypothetical protein
MLPRLFSTLILSQYLLSVSTYCQSVLIVSQYLLSVSAYCQSVLILSQYLLSVSTYCQSEKEVKMQTLYFLNVT